MKAAIVIDNWKLPIFDRHLREAEYSYVKHQGVTEDTLTLTVICDSRAPLEVIVRAANTEAATMRGAMSEVTQ